MLLYLRNSGLELGELTNYKELSRLKLKKSCFFNAGPYSGSKVHFEKAPAFHVLP